MPEDHPAGAVFLPDADGFGVDIEGRRVLASFPSGRPWVVTNQPNASVSFVQATLGSRTAVLIGDHSITSGQIRHALHADTDGPLDRLYRHLDGSAILAVADGARRWLRPPAFGSRRLFYTATDGGLVASDHSFLLIPFATDPSINVRALSAHLLEPIPHALWEIPLISGIEIVPRMSEIRCERATVHVRNWWEPPSASSSLEDGAGQLRERLRASVRARVDGRVASSDLSGGYDSTALCVLAAESNEVIGVTAPSRDISSEDVHWARMAVEAVDRIHHCILNTADLPRTYADLAKPVVSPDIPSIAVTGRSRVLAVANIARAHGSSIHLAGHGGDHAIAGVPTYFHDSIRSSPWASLTRLREFAALCGWSHRDLARAIADRRGYRDWWLSQRPRSAEAVNPREPMLGWTPPLVLPAWATDDSRAHVASLLHELSDRSSPFTQRGLFADIESLSEGARTARAIRQIGESAGIPIASPFTDDRVIEACLATRPFDRVTVREYKPLLRSAMKGVVPEPVLARHTKGDGSFDVATGLAAHRDDLEALWSHSALAELGLINGPGLRQLCTTPSAGELQGGAMYSTIGCELWARTAQRLIRERSRSDVYARHN